MRDAGGNDVYNGWSVPVTTAKQTMTLQVNSGDMNTFATSAAIRRAVEGAVGNVVGALSMYVTCPMEVKNNNVEAVCRVTIPADGSPSTLGAGQEMAHQLNIVDRATVAAAIGNAATSASGSTYTVSVVDSSIATALDVYPTAKVHFNCVDGGCMFDEFPENQYWKYHRQTVTSFSECQRACWYTPECTGFEWKTDQTYCVFWLHRACLVTKEPMNFESRPDAKTCSKETAYLLDESVASGRSASVMVLATLLVWPLAKATSLA